MFFAAPLFAAFVYLVWFHIASGSSPPGPETAPATEMNPVQSGDLFAIGRSLLKQGYVAAAIPFLEKARLLYPDSTAIAFALAQAYQRNRAVEPAITRYQEVVHMDGEGRSEVSILALEKLGNLYARHDRLEESRRAYEQALTRETRPDWILKIKNQLAELDLTEGNYQDDGNTIYNERGEVIGGVGPGDMRTNRFFEIARHTDDVKKKELYFNKAIETDPGMHQAYFNVGLALTKQKRFAEAMPYFEKSNEIWKTRKDVNPDGAEKCSALAYLGLCYLEMGDFKKALAFCDHALAVDDSSYYAYLFKARALLKLTRSTEAIEILRSLLVANPDDAEISRYLREAYQRQGTVGSLIDR